MLFRLSDKCVFLVFKVLIDTHGQIHLKNCFFARRLSLLSILKKFLSNFVKAAPMNVVIFERGASIVWGFTNLAHVK